MPDKAITQKLNRAKKSACEILSKAGYKIEKTNNVTFCITAMRESEWRIIAVGIKDIIKCNWFDMQRKRLEKLPSPSPQLIKKEIWIREQGEHNFKIFSWENNQWVNEDWELTDIFN
jgi:hypothetical protein